MMTKKQCDPRKFENSTEVENKTWGSPNPGNPHSEGTTTQECRGLPCGGTPKVRAKNKKQIMTTMGSLPFAAGRCLKAGKRKESQKKVEREKSPVVPEFIPSRMLDLNVNDRARCSRVAGGLKWQLRSVASPLLAESSGERSRLKWLKIDQNSFNEIDLSHKKSLLKNRNVVQYRFLKSTLIAPHRRTHSPPSA